MWLTDHPFFFLLFFFFFLTITGLHPFVVGTSTRLPVLKLSSANLVVAEPRWSRSPRVVADWSAPRQTPIRGERDWRQPEATPLSSSRPEAKKFILELCSHVRRDRPPQEFVTTAGLSRWEAMWPLLSFFTHSTSDRPRKWLCVNIVPRSVLYDSPLPKKCREIHKIILISARLMYTTHLSLLLLLKRVDQCF